MPVNLRREEAGIYAEETRFLQGEQVVLRPPREDDVEVVYRWDRDPELSAWNGRSPLTASLPAARRDYISRWKDRSVKTYIIEVHGEPVGMATLYDFRKGGCEVGIKIGSSDLRGRGYASDTIELLVHYAFEVLDLSHVRGSTLSHNLRMQRVFEKLGFEEVGDGSILSRYDNRRYAEIFYRRDR